MSSERDGDYFRRCQARATPMGDLKPYWGEWIGVRAGEIVASGSSLAEVRGRNDVRPTDLVMPVPCPEGRYLCPRSTGVSPMTSTCSGIPTTRRSSG